MTEEEHELVIDIVNRLDDELRELVHKEFAVRPQKPEVEEEVRMLLTEQMRFWR